MNKELIKKILIKQGYRFTGNHSSVKICTWTKKSLVDKGVCYKEDFYGIQSHMCCQMTPCMHCPNECIYCWRTPDFFDSLTIKGKIDEPEDIINNCISNQRDLLNGFLGNPKLNKKKFKEAQNPKHFAISESGEPFGYPYLSDLIRKLSKKGITSFLVTNGQFPEKLENLNKLPTQLYVSLDAPTKEIYKKIDKPKLKDYWERLNSSLELISNLKTRTVIRLTCIKGLNMCNEKDYANLIKKANPKFIEIKGYMWVGSSRERLDIKNMPLHAEIKEFAEQISKFTKYKIIDEKKESRVALLMKKDTEDRKLNFN